MQIVQQQLLIAQISVIAQAVDLLVLVCRTESLQWLLGLLAVTTLQEQHMWTAHHLAQALDSLLFARLMESRQ